MPNAPGLAGVVDNGRLFRDVTLSPRFAAAREPEAHVRLEYAASGAAARNIISPPINNKKQLGFELLSRHDHAKLRLFVPEEAGELRVSRNGEPADFREERVGAGRYAVVDAVMPQERVEITYA